MAGAARNAVQQVEGARGVEREAPFVNGPTRQPTVAVMPARKPETGVARRPADVPRVRSAPYPEGLPKLALALAVEFHRVVRRSAAQVLPLGSFPIGHRPAIYHAPGSAQAQFEAEEVRVPMTRLMVRPHRPGIANDIIPVP